MDRSQELSPSITAVTSGQLADLIARVEAAPGPDRELDAIIAWELGWRNDDRYTDGGATEYAFLRQHGYVEAKASIADRMGIPALSASLDAALALVERVLPGALYEVKALPHRRGHGASLWSDDPSAERMLSRADAPTPALALILALLRALQAQQA